MKKIKWIILFTAILILGFFASRLGMLQTMAVITVAVGVAVLLLDYEKATLLVALYTVFEFLLRSVITRPLSQLTSLFGKRAYFDFIMGAATAPPVISSYWDELALLACFGIWFYKWLRYRKEKPYRATPLDISLILFMAVGVVLLFLATPDFVIGVEGLRAVIQYMLWFFVVTQLLKTPAGAKRLLNILVLSALLVSLYGIYQYIIAVDIPASWQDTNEGYVRTRVFSIFTRPNMLAGYLSLLIPVSIGLLFGEKEMKRKLYYGATILCMGICLLFTMSRAGWIVCFCALIIYIWIKNRKLFFPAILGMLALFVFLMLFAPSVSNRILYLLSPQYLASSLKGGRVIRAIQGFELFKENFWFGMGLGQFGGSVALNHKLNETFSMDNNYLKIAVEMGIFGLLSFIALLYSAVAWCSRALSKIRDEQHKEWARGIIAGISGMLVYNLFENMMEIPLLSTYYWMLAGVVIFLGYGQYQKARETLSTTPSEVTAEKTG